MSAEILHEADGLRLTLFRRDTARMIVKFDHWRPDRDGFPQVGPSERMAAEGITELWVTSARNDWFLHGDPEQHLPALRQAARLARVRDAIGFSMGGFGALAFSAPLRLKRVLIVSPVVSIRGDVVPDRRWLSEARALPRGAPLDLWCGGRTGIRGSIVLDPRIPEDVAQVALIRALYPNLAVVPMPFGGHPATLHVVEAGGWNQLQERLIRERFGPRSLRKLHRQARMRSARYRAGLEGWLAGRAGRKPA